MKVMILAAGRGERMRPLTDKCPKPLLRVGGKPLIAWTMERLAKAGFHDVVVNHAYLGRMIERVLDKGKPWGMHVEYSPEEEALETAGGIAKALPLLGDAPFMVVNSDVYCDLNFESFAMRGLTKLTQGKHAHLAMIANPAHHPTGDFALKENGLLSRNDEPRLTFAGIGVYRPELFAHIAGGTKAQLAPILIAAMEKSLVSGEHFKGRWVDVGTPERLKELDAALKTA
ncbi:MAG TPA: nucleotidyltransferase family protein [Rhodocyclaceae bacterium]|nr:nucleotidyltransferase family protein [Rhodocyclaceae bacterium]